MQNTYQRHFLWIVLCLGFCASMADAQNHVLSLDGDGDYMTSPAPPQLSGDTSFTVSFWMKYTPMPNRMWIMDIGKRGALTNVHWLINPDGSMQFGFWEGTQNQFGTSFGSFLRGKWVFVSTIYDSNSKSLKTYLNGILVAIDQVDGTPNLLTDQVQIGLKSGNESDFNGQLDEVQIWNIARTPEEIAATMHTPPLLSLPHAGGKGGVEPGLVVYWRFEEEGGKVIDATGNGHDGQLIGDARRIVSPLPTPDQMHQQYLQSLQLGISVQRRKPSQFTDVLSITVRRVPESTVWKVPSVPVQIEIRDEAKALLATLQSRTDATVNWAVPNEVVGTLLMTAKQTSASGKTLSAQFVCLAHNIVPVTPQVGHTEVYDAASGLDGYEVTDIFLDRNGMLWFASQGAGVSQYDGREFKTFTAQDGLPSNDIRTIFEDSNGVLWFGGWGGVSRYDGKTFKTFTTKDGLVDDSVMAICEAEKGLLWFGTLKGVSRFDGASFRNYTKEDGLASDWVTAITKDHSGNLWFGSNLKSSFSNGKGATRYDGSAFKVFTTQDGHVSNLLKN